MRAGRKEGRQASEQDAPSSLPPSPSTPLENDSSPMPRTRFVSIDLEENIEIPATRPPTRCDESDAGLGYSEEGDHYRPPEEAGNTPRSISDGDFTWNFPKRKPFVEEIGYCSYVVYVLQAAVVTGLCISVISACTDGHYARAPSSFSKCPPDEPALPDLQIGMLDYRPYYGQSEPQSVGAASEAALGWSFSVLAALCVALVINGVYLATMLFLSLDMSYRAPNTGPFYHTMGVMYLSVGTWLCISLIGSLQALTGQSFAQAVTPAGCTLVVVPGPGWGTAVIVSLVLLSFSSVYFYRRI